MALSKWDLENLSPEDQQTMLGYKDLWANDPTQRPSAQAAAAELRAKYGYSGGDDGSQYIPIETFNPPTAPVIPEYTSRWDDELSGVIEQIKSPPTYDSKYEGLIDSTISQIVNRPSFSYDPDTDVAYQAFMEKALRAGDKAYADNIAGLSAMTGGRPNTWAGAVASQARNEYVLQAQEAVIHFEERAYGRYRDETQDLYNLVGLLNSQDEIAYNRFRDTIGDTKDLAGLLLQLDERDFQQYKFMAENTWKTFEHEYNAYTDALAFKKDQISEAIDRTNMLGYVNNTDAVTLGVPAGTLSQPARERAEAMEDYIAKVEIDVKAEKDLMAERHTYDIKILNLKDQIDARSAGRRSSGGGGYTIDGQPIPITEKDAKKRDSIISDFIKYTGTDDFGRMNNKEKASYIEGYINKLLSDYDTGIFGANADWIVDEALGAIRGTVAYQEYENNKSSYELSINLQDLREMYPSTTQDILNRQDKYAGDPMLRLQDMYPSTRKVINLLKQ